MVVYFINTLWFLNIVDELIQGVFASIYQSSLMQASTQTKLRLKIFITSVSWTIELLTFLGLLYCFHHQGRRVLTRERGAITFSGLAHTISQGRTQSKTQS
jgi:hypothetical protein